MDNEKISKWAWYGVISAIIIFLVITNFRLTNLNKNIGDIDSKVNGHYGLITSGSENNKVFEDRVRRNLFVISGYLMNQWLDYNSIDEGKLKLQIQAAHEACKFQILDDLDMVIFFDNSKIVGQINSSIGMLTLNLKNDSTLTCQQSEWFSNETNCEELCNSKKNFNIDDFNIDEVDEFGRTLSQDELKDISG